MRVKSTIDAAMFDFIKIEPSANGSSSLVGLFVDALTVLGIAKAFFTPHLCFCRIIDALSRATITLYNFVGIPRAPSFSGLNPMLTLFLFSKNLWIVSCFYPCKPDIFAATYEPV